MKIIPAITTTPPTTPPTIAPTGVPFEGWPESVEPGSVVELDELSGEEELAGFVLIIK